MVRLLGFVRTSAEMLLLSHTPITCTTTTTTSTTMHESHATEKAKIT